ncbi:MAG: hypothetical protein H0T42_20880 [Deltaproteobacteria bacterium]|nr:hypothetical protein [Deltaproteobacteria bacterium]
MPEVDILEIWLARLAALELVQTGDVNAIGQANLELFSVAEAQDAKLTSAALAGFLRDAHRAYSVAAARTDLVGWFYAWHDTQAGQLRMSACPISSTSELPVRGPCVPVDDPAVVADDALASTVAHGIPLAVLVEVARSEPAPAPEVLPFPVYAQQLLRH